MFYEPRKGHGLPNDPFRAIVAPRPIGWLSTMDSDGRVNLAPYSFFNAISGRPPMVMFSSEGHKHSIQNIEQTGEFVANLVTRLLAERMNETSRAHPREINEFVAAGLTEVPSRLVKPPRVGESPAALECKMTEIIRPKDLQGDPGERWVAIGEVIGIYIDEAYLKNGRFDTAAAKALARCGYWDYATVTETFRMPRPDAPEH